MSEIDCVDNLTRVINKINNVKLAIQFRKYIYEQEITIINKILEYSFEWINLVQNKNTIKSGSDKISNFKAEASAFYRWVQNLEQIFRRNSTREGGIEEATRTNEWNTIDFRNIFFQQMANFWVNDIIPEIDLS